jgi:hypothetical protein
VSEYLAFIGVSSRGATPNQYTTLSLLQRGERKIRFPVEMELLNTRMEIAISAALFGKPEFTQKLHSWRRLYSAGNLRQMLLGYRLSVAQGRWR